jgi:FkbM family methyltransferase
MIVVDVGACHWGQEESVEQLIERFAPRLLLAYDPHPAMIPGKERIDGTLVVRYRKAVWTHNGTVPMRMNKIITAPAMDRIRPYEKIEDVPCVDIVWLLQEQLSDEEVVLKLDCEGCEYPLLAAVREADLDLRLKLVLVEWHTGIYAHGMETRRPVLRCPVEEWDRPTRPAPTPRGPTTTTLGETVRT